MPNMDHVAAAVADAAAREIDEQPRTTRPRLGVALVFLLALMLSGAVVWQSEMYGVRDRHARVTRLTGELAHAIQHSLEHALSATHALAALVRQGGGAVRDFPAIATSMLPLYPGVTALAIAPEGVVTQIVPGGANERAVGLDLLHAPTMRRESAHALETGLLTLAGPIELVIGGTGVVGRMPVFLEDAAGQRRFWGFTLAVIRLPEGLDVAQLERLSEQGLAYELWRVHPDTGGKQIIARSESASRVEPVEQTLHVPNAAWTLSVAPTTGWFTPGWLALKALLALLFSVLLAYLAALLIQLRGHKQRLEAHVTQRTAELCNSRERLRHLLDSMAEAAYGVDLEGKCIFVNRSFLNTLGYADERDVLGKHIHGLIHYARADGTPYPESECRMHRAYLSAEAVNVSDEVFWRQDGSAVSVEYWSRPIFSNGAVVGAVATFIDISDRKAAEARIEHLAHFDALTGLPNRVLLHEHGHHDVSAARRKGTPLAVLFVDLDHFKNVNDTLGHRVGDELLIAVAQRLRAAVREVDTVSRQGGDEFVLILPDTGVDGAMRVAEKLLATVAQPYQIESFELTVTLSIGIALYPDDGADFEILSKNADAAMYGAKRDGRNNFRFFTAEMQARSARNLQMENALRRALEREQLELHYQPQIDLADGRIIGVEALLRWRHPELGMVSPAEFIPLAEESGQIMKIGEWVLATAVGQMKRWIDAGMAPMVMAVNLSAVQFRHPNLVQQVSRILEEAQLKPQWLELELTENVAMDDAAAAIDVMDRLHRLGLRMSIDDFGTGYSSLSYLRRFKMHRLKIDQSFVRDIAEDPEDRAIIIAIITLAHSLGLRTIAEGVETEAQLAFLREHRCDEVQGYLFSRPLPPEQFAAFAQMHGARPQS